MAVKNYTLSVQAVQIDSTLTVRDLLAFLASCDIDGPVGQLVVSNGRPPCLSLQIAAGKPVVEASDYLVRTPTGLRCYSAADFATAYAVS